MPLRGLLVFAGVLLFCQRVAKLCTCEREGARLNVHVHRHHLIVKKVAVLGQGGQVLHDAAVDCDKGQLRGERPNGAKVERSISATTT